MSLWIFNNFSSLDFIEAFYFIKWYWNGRKNTHGHFFTNVHTHPHLCTYTHIQSFIYLCGFYESVTACVCDCVNVNSCLLPVIPGRTRNEKCLTLSLSLGAQDWEDTEVEYFSLITCVTITLTWTSDKQMGEYTNIKVSCRDGHQGI